MSKYSLVPERQLLFSPGLAQTIGLEEAILVQYLKTLFDHQTPLSRDGYYWLNISLDLLTHSLPFWNADDLLRITKSLEEKGVIFVDKLSSHPKEIIFALNEKSPTDTLKSSNKAKKISRATRLPSSWRPSNDLLSLLEINHSIPKDFAKDQLEEFTLYWQERGDVNHAWENKFRQHVLSRWRKWQLDRSSALGDKDSQKLDREWRPSNDAIEILVRADIDSTFIEDALPEFILYWRERDEVIKGINTKFIQHIRLQWSRYRSSLGNESKPTIIPDNWEPNSDLFDILRLAHIDPDFALSVLPEFILYWQENGGIHKSWNSKFLQHVKYHWARRHQFNPLGQSHEKQQGVDSKRLTRNRSIEEDLRDTTWAD